MNDDLKYAPGKAVGLAALLTLIGALIAAFVGKAGGFTPRAAAVDAAAGLIAAAFFVDRILTFMPPFGVSPLLRKKASVADADSEVANKERAAALHALRFGYGALFGSVFVAVTGLKAIEALTGNGGINDRVDRVVAVIAIAGGVAGLARLSSALKGEDAPQTDPNKTTDTRKAASGEPQAAVAPPAPVWWAVGVAALVVCALLALAANHKAPIDLLPPKKQDDGTTVLVAHFGVIILAAAIIQQFTEAVLAVIDRARALDLANRALLAGSVSVILAALVGLVVHIDLLHNLGFFTKSGQGFPDTFNASNDLERWFDGFATAAIIAGSSKPIHDVIAKLRPSK